MVASFPTELITEIIDHHLLPVQEDWLTFQSQRLTVRMVDRRWGAITRDTERYWKVVYLHRFTPLRALEYTAKRKDTCDLTLRIDTRPCDEVALEHGGTRSVHGSTVRYFHDILCLWLRGLCSRAINIDFIASSNAAATRILDLLFTFGLPRLHTINMSNTRYITSPALLPMLTVTPRAVQRVNLDFLDPKILGTGFYTNVTSLRVSRTWAVLGPRAANILDVLEAAPLLEVLQLEDIECCRGAVMRHITLTRLTHFSLAYYDNAWTAIAEYLHCPALTTLRLEGTGETATLQAFHDRAKAMIHNASSVEIAVVDVGPSDLHYLLSAARNVHTLDLRGCEANIGNLFFTALLQRRIRMPQLRRLKLPGLIDRALIQKLLSTHETFHNDFFVISGVRDEYSEWYLENGELRCKHSSVANEDVFSVKSWANESL